MNKLKNEQEEVRAQRRDMIRQIEANNIERAKEAAENESTARAVSAINDFAKSMRPPEAKQKETTNCVSRYKKNFKGETVVYTDCN